MNEIIAYTLTGVASGSFAGLIGAGAEILVVPLLTIFGVLGSLKKRIGTSLFMILPPIGIFSAMNFYKRGYVDVKAALYMAIIFTIFSYNTSKVSVDINTDILRKIFGIFTIISGVYIYFNTET